MRRLTLFLIIVAIPSSADMRVYVDGNNTAADQVRQILAKGKTPCVLESKNQAESDASLQIAQADRTFHGTAGWLVSALLMSKTREQLMSDSETYPKRIVQKVSKVACGN